jgi:hypothetical protein
MTDVDAVARPRPSELDAKLLSDHACQIRKIGKRAVEDIVEIGRRLTLCRDKLCGHGNWIPWLKREFKWSEDTALNFTRVYEMSNPETFGI